MKRFLKHYLVCLISVAFSGSVEGQIVSSSMREGFFQIRFNTFQGSLHQPLYSPDLEEWSEVGEEVGGDDFIRSEHIPTVGDRGFYRIRTKYVKLFTERIVRDDGNEAIIGFSGDAAVGLSIVPEQDGFRVIVSDESSKDWIGVELDSRGLVNRLQFPSGAYATISEHDAAQLSIEIQGYSADGTPSGQAFVSEVASQAVSPTNSGSLDNILQVSGATLSGIQASIDIAAQTTAYGEDLASLASKTGSLGRLNAVGLLVSTGQILAEGTAIEEPLSDIGFVLSGTSCAAGVASLSTGFGWLAFAQTSLSCVEFGRGVRNGLFPTDVELFNKVFAEYLANVAISVPPFYTWEGALPESNFEAYKSVKLQQASGLRRMGDLVSVFSDKQGNLYIQAVSTGEAAQVQYWASFTDDIARALANPYPIGDPRRAFFLQMAEQIDGLQDNIAISGNFFWPN